MPSIFKFVKTADSFLKPLIEFHKNSKLACIHRIVLKLQLEQVNVETRTWLKYYSYIGNQFVFQKHARIEFLKHWCVTSKLTTIVFVRSWIDTESAKKSNLKEVIHFQEHSFQFMCDSQIICQGIVLVNNRVLIYINPQGIHKCFKFWQW